jgi:predicted DNA-binding transcriptional regulator YafY
MRLDIGKEYDDLLRLAVSLAGFLRAGKANVTEAVTAIATGSHQIVPCGESLESRKWAWKCSETIKNTQPFLLTYQSPDEKIETFEVRWATIVYREKRYFLEAWLAEANLKAMSELSHNRSFRFDRILDISPAYGNWHSDGLDSIEVRFRLYGKLATAYERRDGEDQEIITVDGGIEVCRKVTEVFWFTRSMLVYGDGCEVVAPEVLRQELRSKLTNALKRYD